MFDFHLNSLFLISTQLSLSLISTLQSRLDSPSSSKSQASKTKMMITRRRSRAPCTESDWRVSWERRSTSSIQQFVWKWRQWRRIDRTWRASRSELLWLWLCRCCDCCCRRSVNQWPDFVVVEDRWIIVVVIVVVEDRWISSRILLKGCWLGVGVDGEDEVGEGRK